MAAFIVLSAEVGIRKFYVDTPYQAFISCDRKRLVEVEAFRLLDACLSGSARKRYRRLTCQLRVGGNVLAHLQNAAACISAAEMQKPPPFGRGFLA
ncbi:hypothetical protein WJ16_02345 [Burkholderia metallica]|nr:hypothetical protein WJ16_02345 [Burkholderia metallica]